MLTAGLFLVALVAAAPPGRESVVGEAASASVTEQRLVVKKDDGGQVTVTFDEKTAFLRALPGASTLEGASPVQPSEIKAGDRLLCRGTFDAAGSALAANRVVVMTKGDVESQRRKEQEDWQKRSLAGVVTAVDAAAHELTLRTMHAGVAKPVVVEAGGTAVSFRRYAPTSVRFADAKPSSFAEIAVGDQLRVLGNRNQDGTRVAAEKVVSGAFKVVRGTVTEIDAAKGTLSVREGEKGPAVTVAVGSDTVLRRLPTMMVMRLLGGAARRGWPGRGWWRRRSRRRCSAGRRTVRGSRGGRPSRCARRRCGPACRRRPRPFGRPRRGPRAVAGHRRQGRPEGRRGRDPGSEAGGRHCTSGDQGRRLDAAADARGQQRRPRWSRWHGRRRWHGWRRSVLRHARHGGGRRMIVLRLTSRPALAGAIALVCMLPPFAAVAADEDGATASVASTAAEKAASEPADQAASKSVRGGVLRGRVTDPSGAAVPNARIEATGPAGVRNATTDAAGSWTIDRLRPGQYLITVARDGFETAARTDLDVATGRETLADTALSIAAVKETMTITESRAPLGLSADQAAGAMVIEGAQLDALPDDPDELAEALQALAGSAAGPNGGQVFVDGFSGGRMPPRSAIRQIRLNSSPFSAEYDRPGFGRIEILTKPGTEKFQGHAALRFNNQALNTQDPYATSKPDYQRLTWDVDLGGPVIRNKASFFVDVERRNVDEAQLVNATVLGPGYTLVPYNDTVVRPSLRTSVSPRFDAQLGNSHTLTLRYGYTTTEQQDTGIGGFSLPSRGYDNNSTQQLVQVGETAVLGKVVNEVRMQWSRQDRDQQPASLDPALQVQDAFTGGGSSVGVSSRGDDRLEFQDLVTFNRGKHAFRSGVRARGTKQADISRSGFNGTVTFAGTFGPQLDASGRPVVGEDGNLVIVPVTSAERYRRTILMTALGFSPAQIRLLAGGASQLSISGGDPEASVRQWDFAGFLQDDWKPRTDLTLGLGLRVESQTNLSSNLNLAPRVTASWSPGYTGKGTPKTVLRAGAGMFYDRVDDGLVLEANRYNGDVPKRYLVTDPIVLNQIVYDAAGNVVSLPSFDQLGTAAQPQVVRELASGLAAPATLQLSLGVDRALPHDLTLNVTWMHSNTWRALRSRVVDAVSPLATTSGSTVAYQYESTGHQRMDQLMFGLNRRFSQALSLSARYFLGWARSDTDGSGSFPASSLDPAADWGRASNDVRHRFMLMGSVTLPGDVRISPFVMASTGGPYNITIGRDINGDTVFTDRPSYALDPTEPGAVDTPWGWLNPTPLPGETRIARNLGEAPGFVSLNLRLSKTIRLTRSKQAVTSPTGQGGPGGPPGGWAAPAPCLPVRLPAASVAALAAGTARAAAAGMAPAASRAVVGGAGPLVDDLGVRQQPDEPRQSGGTGRQHQLTLVRRVAGERWWLRPWPRRRRRWWRRQPRDRAAGPRFLLIGGRALLRACSFEPKHAAAPQDELRHSSSAER